MDTKGFWSRWEGHYWMGLLKVPIIPCLHLPLSNFLLWRRVKRNILFSFQRGVRVVVRGYTRVLLLAYIYPAILSPGLPAGVVVVLLHTLLLSYARGFQLWELEGNQGGTKEDL